MTTRSAAARTFLARADSSRGEVLAGLTFYLVCGLLAVLSLPGDPLALRVVVVVAAAASAVNVVTFGVLLRRAPRA